MADNAFLHMTTNELKELYICGYYDLQPSKSTLKKLCRDNNTVTTTIVLIASEIERRIGHWETQKFLNNLS